MPIKKFGLKGENGQYGKMMNGISSILNGREEKKLKNSMKKIVVAVMFVLSIFVLSGMAVQAQEHQVPQEQTLVLLGDADGNASVELKDASVLLRMALNLEEVPVDRLFYLDLDDDGEILLADASRCLRVALNLEKKVYYRPLEAEVLYEGIVTTNQEGLIELEEYKQIFYYGEIFPGESPSKKTKDAAYWGRTLRQQNLVGAAETVEKLEQGKLDGRQMYVSEVKVCTDQVEDVTRGALGIKESSGMLCYGLEEYTDIKDTPADSYVMVFLVDEDTQIKDQRVSVSTESLAELYANWNIFKDEADGKICTSYEEYRQAVTDEFFKDNPLNIGESYFEEGVLVLKEGERLWKSREEAIVVLAELEETDNEVVIHITDTTTMINSSEFKERGSEKYAVKLPKHVIEGKQVRVESETSQGYGYERAICVLAGEEDYKTIDEADACVKISQQMYELYQSDNTKLPMLNFSVAEGSVLSEQMVRNLYDEVLKSFPFEQYDALIVPMRLMYIYKGEPITVYSRVRDGFVHLEQYAGDSELWSQNGMIGWRRGLCIVPSPKGCDNLGAGYHDHGIMGNKKTWAAGRVYL